MSHMSNSEPIAENTRHVPFRPIAILMNAYVSCSVQPTTNLSLWTNMLQQNPGLLQVQSIESG